LNSVDREKETYKNTLSTRDNDFPVKNEDLKIEKKLTEKRLNEAKHTNLKGILTNRSEEFNNFSDTKSVFNLKKKDKKLTINDPIESHIHTKNSIFKTSFHETNVNSETLKKRKSLTLESMNKFFCPYCEHCSNLKDQNLDTHMQNLIQANVVINKGFDYMVKSIKFYDKTVIDLFSFTDNNIDEILKDEKHVKADNEPKLIKESIFEV